MTEAPLTFGQLSVWRDVADLPSSRAHEANVAAVWPVPAGVTDGTILQALGELAARHEALRVRYDMARTDRLTQRLPAAPGPVPARVADPGATTEDVRNLELERPFDFGREPAWRAVIARKPELAEVVVIKHHITCDGWSNAILVREFAALVAGSDLPPAPSLIELAWRQQADRDGLHAGAMDYFEDVLAADRAAGRVASQASATVQAGLVSGEMRGAATALAAKQGVSLAAVLLACAIRAVAGQLDRDVLAVDLMTSNRLTVSVRGLVTSMNQWVPALAREARGICGVDGSAVKVPLAEQATAMHRATVEAYRYGCYDVDRLRQLRQKVYGPEALRGSAIAFNFVPAGAAAPGWLGKAPEAEVILPERPFATLFAQPCYVKVFDFGTALYVRVTSRLAGGAGATEMILSEMRNSLISGDWMLYIRSIRLVSRDSPMTVARISATCRTARFPSRIGTADR